MGPGSGVGLPRERGGEVGWRLGAVLGALGAGSEGAGGGAGRIGGLGGGRA